MIKKWGLSGRNALHPYLFWNDDETPWRGPGARALFELRNVLKTKLNLNDRRMLFSQVGKLAGFCGRDIGRFFSFRGQIPAEMSSVGNIRIAWKQKKIIIPYYPDPDKYLHALAEFRSVVHELVMHCLYVIKEHSQYPLVEKNKFLCGYYEDSIISSVIDFSHEYLHPINGALSSMPPPLASCAKDALWKLLG